MGWGVTGVLLLGSVIERKDTGANDDDGKKNDVLCVHCVCTSKAEQRAKEISGGRLKKGGDIHCRRCGKNEIKSDDR